MCWKVRISKKTLQLKGVQTVESTEVTTAYSVSIFHVVLIASGWNYLIFWIICLFFSGLCKSRVELLLIQMLQKTHFIISCSSF